MLDLETLLRVPYVEPDTGFDISPDGTRIAFSWNPTGRWQIYVVPLDGKSPPWQVTTGPGAKFAPRWSPDGGRLAYVLDLDGGELYDLWVCDLTLGLHTNLTPNTPDALQPSFCWSPGGEQIAFLSDRSGCFEAYVIPATGGRACRVLNLRYPAWEVEWSPDGRWLAVVVEGGGQDYWTYLVPLAGGESFPIAAGDDPICAKDTCWSPDGGRLAFASNTGGRFAIGLYDLATRTIAWMAGGERNIELPSWSHDGGRLACVASQGALTSLLVLDLEAGASTSHQIAPGVHYRPHFAPGDDQLAVVFDNPGHPCDLWLLSLWQDPGQAAAEQPFRQLTHSLPADLQNEAFSMPAEVWYPGLDGQPVPALLYRPGPADRSLSGRSVLPPAVVYVHGGPNWLTQVTWDPLVQHMVSRGWVVLAPNYRGSTGYGRTWQQASRFDLGGVDTRDVVAGADYLAREGIADATRIAVTGRSWGGYLTMTCLTQYPDRWAAGSAVVPFLNWFTSHANSREDLQHWDRENFGDPEENRELWRERSPFFFLDRIQAPVQLLCGANDVRCPASESTQARDELLAQGKRCDFELYADEGHSFLKIENLIDVKVRRAAFLAETLEGAGQPLPIQ